MINFKQNKNAYCYASSWPVSRVLSFKAIINLDVILLLHSSGHGNERVTHMFHTLHLTEFTANHCHQCFGWALTSPFHHCLFRLYISVALFLRLPWLDVIKRDYSMVLGLSSHFKMRNCPTNYIYYITIYNPSQLCFFNENLI